MNIIKLTSTTKKNVKKIYHMADIHIRLDTKRHKEYREVFQRVYNILEKYSYGIVKLDFKKYQAFRNNKEINLSSKEFAIMEYFIKHEGETIHRHDLLNEVWGFKVMPTTRTVDNFVLDLRKKLEENPSKPKHIVSVRGIGYRFNSSK